NPALFVVITEDTVYALRHLQERQEVDNLQRWQNELRLNDGFGPVVIGAPLETADPLDPARSIKVDGLGIVTVHDGPSLPPGDIIAPPVGTEPIDPNFHNNFQNPEAFLRAGGRRGRQYLPLTDGTYFINRWFAKVEMIPKIVVPI